MCVFYVFAAVGSLFIGIVFFVSFCFVLIYHTTDTQSPVIGMADLF